MNLEIVRAAADTAYQDAVKLRRELHMYPELSNCEERTMNLVCEYLDQLHIPYTKNVGGHGVVALIGDPEAEFAVGIRADMDALPIQEKNDVPYASKVPGVMHACGHDIHTAALLGTAKVLKGMENELNGAVKLFFQPAEEKGGGARQMIEAGCMNDPPVRNVIGLHVTPDLPTGHVSFMFGKMNASSTSFTITVRGQACHGARPQKGVDAIVAAGSVLSGLQSVVSRSVSPVESAVVTVGTIHGGTKNNIVAGEVEMTGTIRALNMETRELVKQRVREVAEHAAAAHGAVAEVVITDGYPPLVTDIPVTQQMLDVAKQVLGEEYVHIRTEPSLGAEDFAYFTNAVPGTMFRLGTDGGGNAHPQLLHNEWFCPDEECLKNGILLEVTGALSLLNK